MRHQLLALFWTALLCCSLAGCAVQRKSATTADSNPQMHEKYGLEKVHAVEVCKPQGQREYLARLVCPSGEHPAFERIGNLGIRNVPPAGMSEQEVEKILLAQLGFTPLKPGTMDFHVIDAYKVDCPFGSTTIYLDMYHCDQAAPQRAPKGFSRLQ